jgi:glycerophosphoryl diester phosphodiesterase
MLEDWWTRDLSGVGIAWCIRRVSRTRRSPVGALDSQESVSAGQAPTIIVTELVAHRGASAQATENTIAAFELAIELKADYIEFDVHRTRDGVLIVNHDATLSGRLISDWTYADIVRSQHHSHIPALVHTLERVGGRVKLFVEIKSPGNEKIVVDTLRAYVDDSDFVIISFLDEVILAVKTYDASIRVGLLLVQRINGKLVIRGRDVFHLHRVLATRADFIAPRLIPAMLLSVWYSYWYGFPLYVWTVNSPRLYGVISRLKCVETIASDLPTAMEPRSLARATGRPRVMDRLRRFTGWWLLHDAGGVS